MCSMFLMMDFYMRECTFTCKKVNFTSGSKSAFTFIMGFRQGRGARNKIKQNKTFPIHLSKTTRIWKLTQMENDEKMTNEAYLVSLGTLSYKTMLNLRIQDMPWCLL